MPQYFTNFPRITYNGINALNITLRAKMNDNFKKNATSFYPYTIKDGETAENLAFDYYGDSNYCWVIYFTNDIIDPYYDWPLSSYNFDEYIAKKYGSIQIAKSTTAYYKKLAIDYYVNNNNNQFILATLYNPATDGTDWSLVTVDDNLKITALENPDPAIWTEVDVYTDELEQNEEKRYIKLLDRRLVGSIDRQLKDVLNGR